MNNQKHSTNDINSPIDTNWIFNPIILPRVLAGIIMACFGIYTLTQRRGLLQSLFSVMMLSAVLWNTCYIFGLSSTALWGKIFWLPVKYIISRDTYL